MAEEKKYTGYGTCTFANGEYTGELVDGVRQGYGVFKFSNYDIYDGDWEAAIRQTNYSLFNCIPTLEMPGSISRRIICIMLMSAD